MDLSAFQRLGFTPNETQVYMFLVQGGKTSAHGLAKGLRLPRSTVYSVLAALEDRELVRSEKIRGATFYRVDTPGAIIDFIRRKERALKEQQILACSVVDELMPIFKGGYARVPKVEFCEGRTKIERFLNSNLDKWVISLKQLNTSTLGFQDHTFVSSFRSWVKEAWNVIHVKAGIPGRILSNRSDIERSLRGKIPKREVRVLGDEFNFQSSFWIMGDYVVLIMTRESPMYAFQIHDPLLAGSLRLVFRHLYEQAQEIG